jgi:hypothetical protein
MGDAGNNIENRADKESIWLYTPKCMPKGIINGSKEKVKEQMLTVILTLSYYYTIIYV